MNTEKGETRRGSRPDPTLAQSPLYTDPLSWGPLVLSCGAKPSEPREVPHVGLRAKSSASWKALGPQTRPRRRSESVPLLQGTPDGGTSKSYFLRPGAFASSPPGSVSCYLGPGRCFPFRNSPRSSSGVSSHPVTSRVTPCVCVRLPFPNLDPQGSLGTPRGMLAWSHATPLSQRRARGPRPQVPSPEQTQREAAAGSHALSWGLVLPEEGGDSRVTSFPSQLAPTQDLGAPGTRNAVMRICRPQWARSTCSRLWRPARPAQSHCRGRRPRE